jgi:SAM-dependent methyltransferase
MSATITEISKNGTATGRKLDVGAGAHKEPGYETMDISSVFSPDFRHDITSFPWPFEDRTFSEIRCHHVLEHVDRKDLIAVMNEMWRICKGDGIVNIEIPLFPYWPAIADPTHISFFVPQTFAYFCTEESYTKGMKGAKAYEGYTSHRALYGIREWKLVSAKRDGIGSILRVEMTPCV